MFSSNKVLFIGGLFLDSNEKIIKENSKGAVQNAANKLQWNYVKGLEANLLTNIDLLNAVFVGTFPKYYLKPIVKGTGSYRDKENRKIIDVGFVNLPIFAEKTKYIALKKAIKKWIEENAEKNLYIIAYGLFEQNIRALSYAKHFSGVTTCLIVPDLPQYMSLSRTTSKLRNIHLKYIDKIYNKHKINIDYYSLVTKQMGTYLDIPQNKYVVIDGMVEESDDMFELKETSSSDKFSFLYTGGLSVSYGTDILLSSFLKVDNKNAELWICGDGPYTEEIKSASKKDNRIHYFGVLSQSECFDLQNKASCMINPREDSDITPYSFPSKTMEYLMSGKPVIAKKLLGMGDEYSDLFFQFGTSESLKVVMEKISKMDEKQLMEAGLKGRKFVVAEKNNKHQTLKLIKLLTMGKVEQ